MIYDTILYIDRTINEDTDTEQIGIFNGVNPNSQFSLGSQVRSGLAGLGRGYVVAVVDFGADITVCVTYTNQLTGKVAGANFLIKCANKDGRGLVKCSSARWRSISNVGQAISYISSRCSSLQSQTGGQL